METEQQEEELQATEVQEVKPEQLDAFKSSQKGVSISVCSLLLSNDLNMTGFGSSVLAGYCCTTFQLQNIQFY